jgi:hypothetical protein
MAFKAADTGKLLGTLINHGNHPETLGSKNLLISVIIL